MMPDNLTLQLFEEMLWGKYRPWLEVNRFDDKWFPGELPLIPQPLHSAWQFDFYRWFNFRTDFYYRLIVGETNRLCNLWIEALLRETDERIIGYRLNLLLKKRLPTLMRDTADIIRNRGYVLTLVDTVDIDPSLDVELKSETYCFQLMKTALVKLYIEVQERFKSHLNDDYKSIEDLYLQYLREPVPERTFLRPLPNDTAVTNSPSLRVTEPAKRAYQSFVYIGYDSSPDDLTDLCNGLKKGGFIDASTPLGDFKKLFSGKMVERPVRWCGSDSDLSYLIKLIYQQNRSVVDLKQHQWEVACKCFVRKDGTPFDRARLKEQKVPRSTYRQLEKVAGLLSRRNIN